MVKQHLAVKLPQCSAKECLFESELKIIRPRSSYTVCKLHFAIDFYDYFDSNPRYPFGFSYLIPRSPPRMTFVNELLEFAEKPHKIPPLPKPSFAIQLPTCSAHDCPFESFFEVLSNKNVFEPVCHFHFAIKLYDFMYLHPSKDFKYTSDIGPRPWFEDEIFAYAQDCFGC